MLRLQLLGGLTLVDESGPVPGPAAQRKRLALLALLAAAPHGTLSRDKLIACLWAEEPRERARHHLADSVFTLRKALGKELILSTGDDLALNPAVLTCDLWLFRQELESDDLETAIDRYKGPFLDGFFLGDAPEFERWVEEERSRLGLRYAEAMERQAEEVERRAGAARSVTWWRRLAVLDPFNSRVALRLMQALSASGEKGAAIQHARIHAALLREELGMDPDAEVQSLADSLLTGAPATSTVATSSARAERSDTDEEVGIATRLPDVPPGAPPASGRPPRITATAVEPPFRVQGSTGDQPAPDRGPSDGSTPTGGWRSRGRVLAAATPTIVVVALLLSMAVCRDGAGPLNRPDPEPDLYPPARSLVVLPFTYQGSPEYAYVAEGLVTLLSIGLHDARPLRAVQPHTVLSRTSARRDAGEPMTPAEAGEIAADLGAELFLLGIAAETDGRLHLHATLYQHASQPRVVREVVVEGEEIQGLVDRLVRALLAGEMMHPADGLTRVALLTTPSLPALKSYLEGEEYFRATRYPEAVEALQRAVREDPSFALAHYRLSNALEWSFRFREARRSAEVAMHLSERLPPRDQRLITGWHLFVNGRVEEAEREYDAVLVDEPDNVEARSGIGEIRVHYAAFRGRSPGDARPPFQRVLELAPGYGEARLHLLEMIAEAGNVAQFDSLLAGVDRESMQYRAWAAARAYSWPASAPAGERAIDLSDDRVTGVAAVRAAAHFRSLDAALALATELTAPGRPESWRAAGYVMKAQGHLARGEWASADSALVAALPLETAWTHEIRALGLLLPHSSTDAEEIGRVYDELSAWNPRARNPDATFFFGIHAEVHAQLRQYLLAMLSLRRGDQLRVTAHLRELGGAARDPGDLATSLEMSVEAHRAWQQGDTLQALHWLEAQEQLPLPHLEEIALSPFFARSLDRYLRAETSRALGWRQEALRWYASLTEGPDLLFWAGAHRRQAELLNGLGRTAEARWHEERYRSLTPDRRTENTNAD